MCALPGADLVTMQSFQVPLPGFPISLLFVIMFSSFSLHLPCFKVYIFSPMKKKTVHIEVTRLFLWPADKKRDATGLSRASLAFCRSAPLLCLPPFRSHYSPVSASHPGLQTPQIQVATPSSYAAPPIPKHPVDTLFFESYWELHFLHNEPFYLESYASQVQQHNICKAEWLGMIVAVFSHWNSNI